MNSDNQDSSFSKWLGKKVTKNNDMAEIVKILENEFSKITLKPTVSGKVIEFVINKDCLTGDLGILFSKLPDFLKWVKANHIHPPLTQGQVKDLISLNILFLPKVQQGGLF